MPKILVIGAHPDDAEVKAGGTIALWARAGLSVRMVSVTDGSAGHHIEAGMTLAARRKEEAQNAAKILAAEWECLGFRDGQLEPTKEARLAVVCLIRRCQPDLVLTHRPNDYHPDHRYTSQLVQDAAYMVTVPSVAPETPFLRSNPVFGYLSDRFSKPIPFQADVIVPTDSVAQHVVDALDCHVSQFYEWLPFNMGILDAVSEDPVARKASLEAWYRNEFALKADAFGDRIPNKGVQLVEAFEISEYGSPLTKARRAELFPFETY